LKFDELLMKLKGEAYNINTQPAAVTDSHRETRE
jgi:hypothetical protein